MNGKLSELSFPILCFYGDHLRVGKNLDAFITTTRAGLKHGMFRNSLVVDSKGKAFRILDARKLGGVGFLWGYNIFLNQRIKVEPELSGDSFTVSLGDLIEMVEKSSKKWQEWEAQDDLNQFRAFIKMSRSIREVIDLVDSWKGTPFLKIRT